MTNPMDVVANGDSGVARGGGGGGGPRGPCPPPQTFGGEFSN